MKFWLLPKIIFFYVVIIFKFKFYLQSINLIFIDKSYYLDVETQVKMYYKRLYLIAINCLLKILLRIFMNNFYV